MDKIDKFLTLRNEIIDVIIVEFKKTKNSNYSYEKLIGLIPLLNFYKKGVDKILWLDMFNEAKRLLHVDETNEKDVNRIKSVVNRKLDSFVKSNILIKTKLESDKRKPIYIFTDEIKEVFNEVIKRLG